MRRRFSTCCLVGFVAATWLSAGPASADLTADAVRRAKKATALVEIGKTPGRSSFGTAFCIDTGGLFVTNAHVAKKAAHDGLRLVLDTGEKEPRVLSAKVVRTDAALDLALVKVDKAEGLTGLELGKSDQLFETMPLVAFGYPFGTALSVEKGLYPAISVNMGRITSLRQKQGELELIQLDAMLNPGNSGGPVLDDAGRVVGIVQAGVTGAGINFAIPVGRLEKLLSRPEITVSLPKITAAKQHEPHEIGVQVVSVGAAKAEYVVELALSSGPHEQRTMTEKAAGGTAKFSVIPVPTSLGERQLLVEMKFPGGSVAGRVADQEIAVGDRKIKLSEIRSIDLSGKTTVRLTSGKELPGPLDAEGRLTVDLGETRVAVKLQGAKTISVEDAQKPVPSLSYKVTVKAGDRVVGETSGSIEITGPAPAAPAAPPIRPAAPVAGPGVARLEAERVVRNVPATIDDVVAGGGGRFLIFRFGKLRKLGVFDVAQTRITGYVPLASDEVIHAAGSEKLVVIARDQNIVQRYHLETLEKELTVPLQDVGQVYAVAMGYASAGPAVLATANGLRILDLQKLGPTKPAAGEGSGGQRQDTRIRASADGTVFAGWPGDSGAWMLSLSGDSQPGSLRWGQASGSVAPSYDGNVLFSQAGVFSSDFKPLSQDQFRNTICFPAYDPAYFLGFVPGRDGSSRADEKGKLSLYTVGDRRLLVSLTDFDELAGPVQDGSPGSLPMDRRVHFFPTANLLVNIPSTRDQLVLRRLDVLQALDKAGIDYLFAASAAPPTAAKGALYSYTVVVRSKKGGVTCKLESGPEGMTLTPEGKLAWNVPPSQTPGRVGVIITIRDASGQEIFHSFNITVR